MVTDRYNVFSTRTGKKYHFKCVPGMKANVTVHFASRASSYFHFIISSHFRAHKRTRNAIERGFGTLKRRFACLHNEMRMSPQKVTIGPGALTPCLVTC